MFRFVNRHENHLIQHVTLSTFLLVFLFVSDVHSQALPSPSWSKTAGSLTIFQPGDAVRIQVWELYSEGGNSTLGRNMSQDYPISPGGYIIMPILGEVKVKGLTVYELMQDLQEKLREYMRNPLVYVQPLIRLTLQGAFNRPGALRVPPSSSLWDVIAIAGGPRGDCDLSKISIERGGRVIIKGLLNSFEQGYSLEDIGVESGDQIVAPTRSRLNLYTLIGIINLLTSVALLYLRLQYKTY
ncbi:polysaccharide biosynthesis/export family protein [candidate division KSB1 bacterium]|nr:polysaccharide biosynthesis/export family protein [candidate division KSB1 bacterium]